MFRRLALALLVVATAFAAVPAPAAAADQTAQCSFPYTLTDATGTEVTIPENPDRVVTTGPSAAQTMWEIGAKDEVVGVSQYAGYLDGADAKANVSANGGGPSVEAVLAQDPDLVLVPNATAGYASDRVAKLRETGVPVVVFEKGTSLGFVADKTEKMGRITGNCEAGTARADEMRRSVRNMHRALEGVDRPVGLNSFYGYTSGNGTFIGEVMRTAGLRNGADEAGISGFAKVNEETVVEMDPDYLVMPTDAPLPKGDAYEHTTAMREDNVVRVDTNVLQQPAPRSIEAAETIMKAVHPDAYERYRQLQNQTPTESATAATTTSPTTADEPKTTASSSSETTDTGAPGFGAAVSLVALAAATLLARRR